jgi:hypothetical protein
MGTSSRKSAPSGGDWTRAKTRLTNWANSGGTNTQLANSALAAFVGALGGASAAASQATGGVRAAAGLGEFLADVGREGLDTTLDRYGLTDLVGEDAFEVINEISNRIAGAGETAEEAVARDALRAVLAAMLDEAETYEDLEAALVVDEDRVRSLIALYLVEYIFTRVMQELGKSIADNVPPGDGEAYERRLHADLEALVRLDLEQIADPLTFGWTTDAGRAAVRELFERALLMITSSLEE